MKNLFIAVLTFTLLISCGVEEIEKNETQINVNYSKTLISDIENPSKSCLQMQEISKANLSHRSSCTFINVDPITTQSITHGSFPSFGSECNGSPCFTKLLRLNVQKEVWDQTTNQSNVRPTNVTYVTSGSIFLMFSDVINTSNLYPSITAAKSNLIYEEISCQILNHIDTLPLLPTGQFYDMRITYEYIDFTLCGGPEDTYIDLNYDIRKW